MQIIQMSKMYGKLPSEIINLKDEYVAFCFNEACFFIRAKIEEGEMPDFDIKKKDSEGSNHYKSFSSMYDSVLNSI